MIDDSEIHDHMSYEEMTDIFMRSMAGQSSNVTRAEFMRKLRARFPDVAALRVFIQDSKTSYDAAIDQYNAARSTKQ